MARRLHSYWADFLIVLGLLLLPILLYGSVTFGSKTMLPADNLFQWAPWQHAVPEFEAQIPQNHLVTDLVIENYVWKKFVAESVKAGEIPLWNPYLFAGAPFLAAGQHSAYYPFSIFFLILPLAKAYGWYALSQLWLAGVLMYLFGRVLRMHRASAAIAGVVFQASAFLVISTAVFPMIIGAAIWLPFLLACVEKIIAESRLKIIWAGMGAAALGVQIFAGHIEITYYTLLIMAIYAVCRMAYAIIRKRQDSRTSQPLSRAISRPFLWLSSMVLVGLLLGSVQLIPLFEVGQANFREGSASFAEVQSWAFKPRRILTLVLPNFYGNPATHSYRHVRTGEQVPFTTDRYGHPRTHNEWGFKNYVEGAIYLGILPLFLMVLGVWHAIQRIRRRQTQGSKSLATNCGLRHFHTWLFVGLSFFSVAFIFGTPLYALLYYGLPFINQLHTPFRWIFPLTLCVAALAGFGADYLANTSVKVRDWQLGRRNSLKSTLHSLVFLWGTPSGITGMASLAFWSGLLLLVGLFGSRAFYSQLEPMIERVFLGMALADLAFDSTIAFYSYQFRQLFILGLMLVSSGVVLRASRCLIFLTVPGVGKRPLWEWLAVIVIIIDSLLANYGFNAATDPALLAYKPEMVQWLEEQPGLWRLTSYTPSGDIPFRANSGWLYNFQDIRGYDSIIPKQYTEYMAAIEPQNALLYNQIQPITHWESLHSPLLDILNTKYVITSETIDSPKYALSWQGEGVRIYENLGAAPRAYTLPITATAVVDDALLAMQEFDPRHYVVIEEKDLKVMIEEAAPDTPSSIFNFQSSTPNEYTPATIDQYGSSEVLLSASVDEPAWLILNDSYFPGWKAFVRPAGTKEDKEQQTKVLLVNGNFRGVLLEEGDWTIRFKYSPTSFQLGGLASFMGLIILAFVGLVWVWRQLVRPDVEMSTTRSLAKNSMAPMVLNLFNRSIDFVFAMFYLRVLGPAETGSYSTAIATAMIFEIIANYGLDILLVREVSQDRNQASRYLFNTSILRIGAAFVGIIPIVILVQATNLFSNPLTTAEIIAILLIMLGMVFSGMSKGVTSLFYVHEKAELPAAVTTLTTIMKVGFGVVVLLLGYSFIGLAVVSIISNVITLVVLLLLAQQNFTLPGPWKVDWGLQKRMVRLGFPLMLIHLLQTIFISIDVYLLRIMLPDGEEVVGWYNSAYKWFNALQIVPSFFTLALFPIILREIERSLEAARRMYTLSLKLMLLLALPIAASTTFLATMLVAIVAGPEFLPQGAIALQIVIWAIPIGWLNSVTNYVLIALGLERMQAHAFTIAVAFNIIANLIFIPQFSFVAAGVTTILSEVVLMIMFAYYLRKKMTGVNWWQLLAKPLALTAVIVPIMALITWFTFPILGVLVGLAMYAAGLIILRIIGEEERAVLRSILPRPLAARLRI